MPTRTGIPDSAALRTLKRNRASAGVDFLPAQAALQRCPRSQRAFPGRHLHPLTAGPALRTPSASCPPAHPGSGAAERAPGATQQPRGGRSTGAAAAAALPARRCPRLPRHRLPRTPHPTPPAARLPRRGGGGGQPS